MTEAAKFQTRAARDDERAKRGDARPGRPVISLAADDGAAAIRDGVAVLARAGGLFNRAGELVRVVETREARALGLRLQADDGAVRRDDLQPVIVSVTGDFLRVHLDGLARFERHDARAKAPRALNCPKDFALAILALGEWDEIPPLRAITRSPFLRSDGTICDQAGYDAASATLLVPSGRVVAVPSAPTRSDALAALAQVRRTFDEVPWLDPSHEAAFIAYVLTLATRPILPTSPGFIFSAPAAGSGKTLLVDCAGLLVHGITPAKRSYPRDGDEMRKVLHTALLAGDSSIAFDNVLAGSSIGGAELNAYLTADVVADRTLGRSSAPRVVNAAVFSFTGNNVGARADFVRRAVAVALDPNCERPEERTFRIADLRTHIRGHRPELLAAVLTILRAFVLAGAPAPKRAPLGSFEAWDGLVCGCVAWLGLPDPVETQAAIRAEDPDATSAGALFAALHAATEGGPFKAGDLRRLVDRGGPDVEALAEAIAGIGGQEKLGYWLRTHNGQVRAGFKLQRDTGSKTGHATWRVAAVRA